MPISRCSDRPRAAIAVLWRSQLVAPTLERFASAEQGGALTWTILITWMAEFLSMQNERTLTALLDEMQLSEFELKSLAIRAGRHYTSFVVRKKSGGVRNIEAPSVELKKVQRLIAKKLLRSLPLHDACMGYRTGRSILSNAQPHANQPFVLNIDLLNFFPSISFKRVIGLFASIGFANKDACLLARLTTHNGVLPQGAPTSPDIANLIARGMDERIFNFCRKRNWRYTRYCDDLTISGAGRPELALATIGDIIASEGFSINQKKTRIRRRHQRQSVTGLVVNERPSLPCEQRRLLRAMCHQLVLDPESFRGVAGSLLGRIGFASMVFQNSVHSQAQGIILDQRRLARRSGGRF